LEKDLKILATVSTPEVTLDSKGFIKFTGRLISENPIDFFEQVEIWIKEYSEHPAENTFVEVSLEYINSVGIKFLLNIIHEIAQIYIAGNNGCLKTNWYYEDADEDMLEKGTFLSMVLELPFSFVRIA
jgi:hypothetical protein